MTTLIRTFMCASIVGLAILVGQTVVAAPLPQAEKEKIKSLSDLNCTLHQVAKSDGSGGWSCQPDEDRLTGLNCGAGEVAKSNGAGGWACAADTNTDTDTLADLTCTQEGDIAVYSGDPGGQWECASDLPRFVDNGDGTVTDHDTGLMWEKMLASTDIECMAALQADRDVRCQQNRYTWTNDGQGGTAANGTLYTDFLERLNDLVTPNDGTATTCFAGHCDWRVSTIGELRSILLAEFPNCPGSPCIDEGIFGPTLASSGTSSFWSSSLFASFSGFAWSVSFANGNVGGAFKSIATHARAVRTIRR